MLGNIVLVSRTLQRGLVSVLILVIHIWTKPGLMGPIGTVDHAMYTHSSRPRSPLSDRTARLKLQSQIK